MPRFEIKLPSGEWQLRPFELPENQYHAGFKTEIPHDGKTYHFEFVSESNGSVTVNGQQCEFRLLKAPGRGLPISCSALIAVVVVVGLGGLGWFLWTNRNKPTQSLTEQACNQVLLPKLQNVSQEHEWQGNLTTESSTAERWEEALKMITFAVQHLRANVKSVEEVAGKGWEQNGEIMAETEEIGESIEKCNDFLAQAKTTTQNMDSDLEELCGTEKKVFDILKRRLHLSVHNAQGGGMNIRTENVLLGNALKKVAERMSEIKEEVGNVRAALMNLPKTFTQTALNYCKKTGSLDDGLKKQSATLADLEDKITILVDGVSEDLTHIKDVMDTVENADADVEDASLFEQEVFPQLNALSEVLGNHGEIA